jgi:hypothetical protein
VLPLALLVLLAIALLVAILMDIAVQELREGRGDLVSARAEAVVATALADFLAAPAAADFAAWPRGATSQSTTVIGADTAQIMVQALGGGLARVLVAGHAWMGGIRADAASMAFVRAFVVGSGTPPPLRFRRIPGWWWTPIP